MSRMGYKNCFSIRWYNDLSTNCQSPFHQIYSLSSQRLAARRSGGIRAIKKWATYFFLWQIMKNKSLLGNIAKRTYNGFAKSEDIQNNILQMEKAMAQLEQDISNKKKFRNEK